MKTPTIILLGFTILIIILTVEFLIKNNIINMKKFIELKERLSAKLPVFAPDSQKHYFVLEIALYPVCLLGALFGAVWALWGIALIFAVAVVWEVLGFIEKGFNSKTIKDSKKDIAIAFTALFRPFAVFLILHTI